MATIEDDEFGTITIRRSRLATHVRISVAPNGTLRASLPLYAPVFMVKRLIKSSRDELRKLLSDQVPQQTFSNGMAIGKSHTLIVQSSSTLSVARHGQQIIVRLPEHLSLDAPQVINELRQVIITALRTEAKNYLPRRLAHLAKQLDCSYERVRFSHASGRWGSCSSSGTISLNIALMKLPHELIDYVLVHELCHTKQMNHSQMFWQLVEQGDSSYKLHRRELKKHSPTV